MPVLLRLLALLLTIAIASLISGIGIAAPRKVTFVLTSDIYKMSEQNGRGGYARLASVIKAERERGGKVIVVHAGDAISPCLMCSFDQGEHVIDITNRLGVDFFVPGNHEYDFGRDVFLKRMGEAHFPVYAANLRGADGLPLKGLRDSEIIETEGTITAVLAGTMFRVALANKHLVLAHISGKMRKRFIRLTLGDRVKIEMSSYDLNKARIVYRIG